MIVTTYKTSKVSIGDNLLSILDQYLPVLQEKDVVVIDMINKAGALKSITAKLAEQKIDILYTYGTACPEGCPARLIFSTSDNERALISIKK